MALYDDPRAIQGAETMSEYGDWEVLQAIGALLDADVPLNALVSGVFDEVPKETPYPYVLYESTTVRDESTKTNIRNEYVITLHSWSHAPGKQETMLILAALHTALHDATLAITGQTQVLIRFTFSETFPEDGDLIHGVIRFRLLATSP